MLFSYGPLLIIKELRWEGDHLFPVIPTDYFIPHLFFSLLTKLKSMVSQVELVVFINVVVCI